MNVSLPASWEQWIQSQVRSGEFSSPSDVVYEALMLFRDRQEQLGLEEMRCAFAGLDQRNARGEPTDEDLAMIDRAVRSVRKADGRRK